VLVKERGVSVTQAARDLGYNDAKWDSFLGDCGVHGTKLGAVGFARLICEKGVSDKPN
jgi:hypothetical protein